MKAESKKITSTSIHMTGIAVIFVAVGVGLSTLVSIFDNRVDFFQLLLATLILVCVGSVLFKSSKLGATDQASIFTAVGTTWLVVSLLGTIPYLLAGTFSRAGIGLPEVFVDSLFESVSGFTSTGFTIFENIKLIDQSLILWRSSIQWIGGLYFLFSIIYLIDIYDESFKKTLTNIDRDFSESTNSLSKTSYSLLYINELLIRLLPKDAVHEDLFQLYEGFLVKIHAGENIELTLRSFELDMLEMLGYGLDFENEIDKTNEQKNTVSNNQISNMSNIYQSILLAKKCSDLVYFVEDDYIHTKESFKEIVYTYEKFATILEKDIFLCPADYPYLYTKSDSTNIFLGNKKHWRTVDETLCTFLTSRLIVNKYWDKLEKWCKFEHYPWGNTKENPLDAGNFRKINIPLGKQGNPPEADVFEIFTFSYREIQRKIRRRRIFPEFWSFPLGERKGKSTGGGAIAV